MWEKRIAARAFIYWVESIIWPGDNIVFTVEYILFTTRISSHTHGSKWQINSGRASLWTFATELAIHVLRKEVGFFSSNRMNNRDVSVLFENICCIVREVHFITNVYFFQSKERKKVSLLLISALENECISDSMYYSFNGLFDSEPISIMQCTYFMFYLKYVLLI